MSTYELLLDRERPDIFETPPEIFDVLLLRIGIVLAESTLPCSTEPGYIMGRRLLKPGIISDEYDPGRECGSSIGGIDEYDPVLEHAADPGKEFCSEPTNEFGNGLDGIELCGGIIIEPGREPGTDWGPEAGREPGTTPRSRAAVLGRE